MHKNLAKMSDNDSLFLNVERLRVKLLAFPTADLALFEKAKKKHISLFNPEQIEFVNDKPDILMFLTGGSEHIAIESVQEYRFYLMLASREANAWASAMEVKAWMNQHNISSLLINTDDPLASTYIQEFYKASNGIHHLHGQRLGVVGKSSPWLVASSISPFLLQSRLGIEQVDISWSEIMFDEIQQVSPDFTTLFGMADDKNELMASGRIFEGLASLIPFYRLNALSVECFPLVNQTSHTACLALAKLNLDGFPTACEADSCSAAGMMLANEVCGVIPWMANTILVEGNRVMFAHCTAPLNLLEDFKLDSHFETGKGYAVAGSFRAPAATIFRLDNTLNKIFITKAEVKGRPKAKTACRTQLEVEVPGSAARYFTDSPFGNHHLILPHDCTLQLKLAARLLRMEVVE
jgi:L-fucose isomerase-like protein